MDFPESANIKCLELGFAARAFENLPVNFGDMYIAFANWTDLYHFMHS